MPKQQITIEVDIPDGYEATGEHRLPSKGETYIEGPDLEDIVVAGFDYTCNRHIIVRKKWQWPEWIKLPYIAMQPNGDWYGFSDKPSFQDGFRWDGHGFVYLLSPDYFDFTPPECTDWKQSLRKNPNAK